MSEACEFPKDNATNEEIVEILKSNKTIAVVGLSDKPERDSHRVGKYLQEHGYRIIPVNPNVEEVLGEKSYSKLENISDKVDIIDIFRKPEAIPAIVDSAVKIGTKIIWMQEGIVHNEAADKARQAGLKVVMNKCMMKEHRMIK